MNFVVAHQAQRGVSTPRRERACRSLLRRPYFRRTWIFALDRPRNVTLLETESIRSGIVSVRPAASRIVPRWRASSQPIRNALEADGEKLV